MGMKAIAPIYTSDFEFGTKGRRVNVTKMAKGLAKAMDRQYLGHKATVLKTKVKGILVTTGKGYRLTDAQKASAKKLLK